MLSELLGVGLLAGMDENVDTLARFHFAVQQTEVLGASKHTCGYVL